MRTLNVHPLLPKWVLPEPPAYVAINLFRFGFKRIASEYFHQMMDTRYGENRIGISRPYLVIKLCVTM